MFMALLLCIVLCRTLNSKTRQRAVRGVWPVRVYRVIAQDESLDWETIEMALGPGGRKASGDA